MFKQACTAAAVAALVLAGAAQAQTGTAVKDAMVAGDVVTVTAKIESVDQAKRTITLKDAQGRVSVMNVGPEVKNFAQVKAGDELVLKHAMAVAVELKKGSAGREKTVTTVPPQAAPAGGKPGVATATQTVIVANVQSVDAARSTVVLEGPGGRYLPVKVKDPAVMKEIKAGDSVEVTYIEATVLEVIGPARK
jgi:Cu/Ag efflux protein CusF